ncbi:MAG: hypothetical protein HQL28_01635 [Candidatus Omnitrophica bacterium]|nr:hypothetical protein [Candidatus Omnitrophota bacterium]
MSVNKNALKKKFGPASLSVFETVAKKSGAGYGVHTKSEISNVFSLRIDADEYYEDKFPLYYPLFGKYIDCVSIFFNAYSFKNAVPIILKCKDLGVDIQSHAYYHYVYNDYAGNRYNINKAKKFFEDLGINTIGFAAPMGKWNPNLMRALEDEGYKYSSDFSYDYLGLPSRPVLSGRACSILEIPIFPVAPELFIQEGYKDTKRVAQYYKDAIDEMMRCNLPVIIYAHTSKYTEIPSILEEVLDYALNVKKLIPKNMTDIYNMWTSIAENKNKAEKESVKDTIKQPSEMFRGVPVKEPLLRKAKDLAKEFIDFERITPPDELRCNFVVKMLKLLARKIIR